MSKKSTYSTLMDAIQSNDLQTFRSILQSEDALQNGLWWMDYDLLTRALALERKVFVDYMLENGCCVWKPHDKTTPLHVAVAKPNWHDNIEKLLCLGARVSAKDMRGDTAVHVAFKTGAPCAVLDVLIESYLDETNANIDDDEQLGVLHITCTRPHVEFVKQFLHIRHASIDSMVSMESNSSHAGYTPLHFAVEYGRHELVEYLLERGANLYLQDRNGSTPLHLALEYCDIKMVNLICYYISKFENFVNSRGLSHFMAACASNDPSLVEKYLSESDPIFLINSQVEDVDGYPFAGYTPLHFAAVYERVHTARMLLYCGEELFWAATASNHTASSLAFEKKRYRMTKLFAAYCEGGDIWTEEIRKIDKESVARKIVLEIEDDSFSSCCDFDVLSETLDCKVESAKVSVDADENLDNTMSVSDDDEIDQSVRAKGIVDCESSIHITPLSTRSLYGKRDEIFLTRMQKLHKLSKRFFFNVDRNEDERVEGPSFFAILPTVRPFRILIGTLFLWPLYFLITFNCLD